MSAARATTIEGLGLRVRTRHVLLAAGIRNLPELLSIPLLEGKSVFKIPGRSHLRALPEVGPKMEVEVLAALRRARLRLAAPRRPSEECGCPSCVIVFGPWPGSSHRFYDRLASAPTLYGRITARVKGLGPVAPAGPKRSLYRQIEHEARP